MSLLGKAQVVPTNLEDEMRSSYLDYSMSVIVSRALPDVRDGMKPVHRRILYAMQDLGLLPNKAYKKSARLVGEVLGKYHPHGDSSVYDAMVRMAQPWNMRYPLVDGQGNYGSIDNDPPAAMRYTETRMDSISTYILKDIDKNTVDFQPNFDDSLNEPTVLPSVIPTLLINGASGIAVGMATNIPTHNLRDICEALQAYIRNQDISDEEIMQIIKAPDFPTGGIIYGYEGVRDTYLTGRGRIILRAKAIIEENQTGTRSSIVVTELPYQVNKASLIEKIADLVRNKVVEDISELRDESDRDGLRVVMELKRDAIPSVVLNNLYKHTQMQVTFGSNMLALVNGRPITLTIREMMVHFIDFRNEIIVRRTQFELDVAQKRAHILEGLIIALDNLDAVIKTIREAKDTPTASSELQSKFSLSETQAKAILEMRLQRLTGLERDKIRQEYEEILLRIKELQAILASKELQLNIISDELDEIKEKFGDERRTEIVYNAKEFTVEDMIADEDVIVTISRKGFIKRTSVSNYRRQNKGGRGSSGTGTYDEDFIEIVFQSSTHDNILFFTDLGKVYRVKVYDIPEGSRNAKGRSLANIIPKQNDENVTAYLPIRVFTDYEYVVMATKLGTIKKTELSAFSNIRQNGIIAVNLNDNDRLISARVTDGKNEIILGTRNGYACRFSEQDVRPMGRTATGVKGINLQDDDHVVSMIIINNPNQSIFIVGEKGYGKRSKYQEYRLTKRGAKGVISMNVTAKTGKVIRMLSVTDSEDLVVITASGILIRQSLQQIRIIGRNTQGVKIIRLDDEDYIADITSVPNEETDIDETEQDNNISTDELF